MAQVTVTPPSRFVRLARLCNRHRWRTFGVWLLALILIQVVAASVGVKEISSFRLPGTESQRAYDLLDEHFPAAKGDTDQIVYKARNGSLEDTPTESASSPRSGRFVRRATWPASRARSARVGA
jgi:uncharacterized membrane protein YdfJ with MMPL/SSD domain